MPTATCDSIERTVSQLMTASPPVSLIPSSEVVAAARGIPHVTLAFGAALPPPLLSAVTAKVADIWAAEGIAPSPDAGLYDHL